MLVTGVVDIARQVVFCWSLRGRDEVHFRDLVMSHRMVGDRRRLTCVVTFFNLMNVLEICQEAVTTGFISSDLAYRLRYLLWLRKLSSVELATLEFISRRIDAGKIRISSVSNHDMSRELQRVN